MTEYKIPIIANGEVIEDYEITHSGRFGSQFVTPDPHKYLHKLLPENRAQTLKKLYALSVDDILEYLIELGNRLDLDTNKYLQEALELCKVFARQDDKVNEFTYRAPLKESFSRGHLEDVVGSIGREYLEGWVQKTLSDGKVVSIRPVGVPTAHVVAGNNHRVSTITLIRNALIRGHAIVKIPSNELGSAIALARTMIDMDATHPLTKAFNCVYWKGGDTSFEEKIYHPKNIDRIVAWGDGPSIRHIGRYVQPGIDLCNFDPKNSRAIIGKEGFEHPEIMQEVAMRVAADIGYLNQMGCLNCRVAFVQTGTDEAGLEKARKFGDMVFEEIQKLPSTLSNTAKVYDHNLKSELDGIKMIPEEYYLVGGDERGGAVVSLSADEVDFSSMLDCRTVNIIPIDDMDQAIKAINRDVQSIGIFPESLKKEIRLDCALKGAQRLTSLGYMTKYATMVVPHDGVEGLRRMATWIVEEDQMENYLPIPWRDTLTGKS